MPNRRVPWTTSAKDLREIMSNVDINLPTVTPHVVTAITQKHEMTPDLCWEFLVAGSRPECIDVTSDILITSALGLNNPSTLTRMAIEGFYGHGPPLVAFPGYGANQAVLRNLSVGDRALTQLQWARDGFYARGGHGQAPAQPPPGARRYPEGIVPDDRRGHPL